MPFTHARHHRVLFVRWGTPELPDLRQFVDAAKGLHARQGIPPIVIAVTPETAPAPSDEVRAAMVGMLPEVYAHTSTFHLVIEGVGFASTVKRAAVAGILLFAGKRGKFFTHAKVTDVLTAVPKAERHLVEDAIAHLEATGFLPGRKSGPWAAAPPTEDDERSRIA